MPVVKSIEKQSEKQIQNQILRTVGAMPWLRIWRQNVGVVKMDGERPVKFGFPGQADISGILPGGIRLEIEVKSATGRQSQAQKNFQTIIEKIGGVYILARSVQDVLDVILKYHEGEV